MSQPSSLHEPNSAAPPFDLDRSDSMDVEDFEEALAELVEAANENDVHLGRAFDVRSDGDQPNWMVEISRLR